MIPIHTPERQPGESVEDYKTRRKVSRKAVARMTLNGIGDQHKAPSSRQQLRDEQRKNGNLRGVYGDGLRALFDRNRRQAIAARNDKRMGVA